MKKITLVTLIFILFSSCQLFLGAEHDTGPEGVLVNLWNDFNIIHAYIDVRMSNNKDFASWEDVLHNKDRGYKKKLSDGMALFDACGLMLRELGDPHVGLYAPGKYYYSATPADVRTEMGWFTLRNNPSQRHYYLQDGGILSADKDSMFLYGLFNEPYENIGYVHIKGFTDSSDFGGIQDWVRQINVVADYLITNSAEAVVVDIRNNDGGSTLNMEYIAARFAARKTDYLRISTKKGPGRNDFTDPVTYSIQPDGTRYTNNVALLTNKTSVSAAEWFTMAMRQQNHITHMGTTTRGALSARVPRSMINGWYYTISADKVEGIDGKCYEGVGIRPDKPEYIITGEWEEWEAREWEGQEGNREDRQLNKVLEKVSEWLAPLP